MKITSVEVFDCEVNRKDPTMAAFNPVFVRLNTNEGVSGIGEVGLAYGNASKAAVGILRDFGKRLIGLDPMNVEAIWEMFYRTTFWGMGGGPVIYGGVSAVDIACWDIRGKVLNAPIWQLLGGKTNPKLRSYASQLQFDWSLKHKNLAKPEEYAAATKKAMDEGYDCIKVDPLMIDKDAVRNPKQKYFGLLSHEDMMMGLDRLVAMRDALGPEGDIIVEIHSFLGGNSAIQFGRAVDDLKLNILYYEEPVAPMNQDLMATVAQKVHMPVASGERIYTRWGYRPFFEKQALAVIQPDACLVGGITETKKICDYANTYDATVQVHVCGGPISTAASLHIETVIPNFIIHEHHTYALKACIRELCTYDYQPENGYYVAPERPGLGQELNDAVCKDYLAYTIK